MTAVKSAGVTGLAPPAWWRLLVWLVLPLVGAGLGWAVRPVARWAVDLDWLPLPGPVGLVASLPQQATIALVALGVLAGLALAGVVQYEELGGTVADGEVVLRRKGAEQRFARAEVGAVFAERGRVVLLGTDTRELADHEYTFKGRVAAAFRAHGYPWTEGDPHRDEFRRWVPGLPDLPAGADPLFAAREAVLKSQRDAAELRAELSRLGVVVRDRDGRQYWRRIPPAG
ncbi:hypothetical protein DPM19_31040 [Actinomadura craniellae]|uniref:DUF308 domain-containing protein n=1 Tax=Actinomadura craniellae TaxID=2231787 RepID=A0A365GWJ0_9ACTN|nr:hypothetical protein [Actinomadura craniellae]RAY11197.1 hypothetical protein DPM19_31040 [Actinomadura craniellae]